MAFVVTDICVNCKFTDCVEVCPVDCFYEGPNMLVIDPDECIDCGLCEPACPINAIVSEDELREDQQFLLDLNLKYARKWPNCSQKKSSPFDTDHWKNQDNKVNLIEDYD
ncbi:MAG: ferredoxin family protein [Gammaproteobacteria bacterium]|nr:ferredoxin family protein [Gammaproteobacteria bacterium]